MMFGIDDNNNDHSQMIIDMTMSITEETDLYQINPLIRCKSFDLGDGSEWELDTETDIEYDTDVWKKYAKERILQKYIKNNSEQVINYPNDSQLYKNNSCFCCKNYLMIHICNFVPYLERYKKDTNYKYPKSSKNIQKLYRLKPELFNGIDISKIKYLNNVQKGLMGSSGAYVYRYENLMFNENNKMDMVNTINTGCLICKKSFCDTHLDYNPVYRKKCSCCNKRWDICSWCLYDDFSEFIKHDKIEYEEEFCNVFHKGTIPDSVDV